MSMSGDFCRVSFPFESILVVSKDEFFVHVPRGSYPFVKAKQGNAKNELPFYLTDKVDDGHTVYALQRKGISRDQLEQFQFIQNRSIRTIWARLLEKKWISSSVVQDGEVQIHYSSLLDEQLFSPAQRSYCSKAFVICSIALLILARLAYTQI
jgi:hypothetical protein